MLGFIVVGILGVAQAAFATSATTDQSDLWYVPTESGWGMQLVQRDAIIFSTLFVYDLNGKATWFVATMTYQGNLVSEGDLLATTGPWFGAIRSIRRPLSVRKARMISWRALQRQRRHGLPVPVDGVWMTKNIIRQSLAVEDYSGHYAAHGIALPVPAPTSRVTWCPRISAYSTSRRVRRRSPLRAFRRKVGHARMQAPRVSGRTGLMIHGGSACSSSGGCVHDRRDAGQPSGNDRADDLAESRPPGCQNSGWIGGVHVTVY